MKQRIIKKIYKIIILWGDIRKIHQEIIMIQRKERGGCVRLLNFNHQGKFGTEWTLYEQIKNLKVLTHNLVGEL